MFKQLNWNQWVQVRKALPLIQGVCGGGCGDFFSPSGFSSFPLPFASILLPLFFNSWIFYYKVLRVGTCHFSVKQDDIGITILIWGGGGGEDTVPININRKKSTLPTTLNPQLTPRVGKKYKREIRIKWRKKWMRIKREKSRSV